MLELAGNKVRALQAAEAAGIPTLRSTPPSADLDELVAGAEEIGFPVFVKAVAGGGGRGMRRVDDPAKLRESVEAAMREAEGAFGDPTAFIEQAVGRPRHIEVQILADTQGHVMHLFERDCSIQRRHQKVIEIAPAPHISDELRAALCADAVKFAESINYSCAGTVEFLVETEGERAGQHVFIEMNPRIQVEHTVTEEITDVDLVQSQMRIASRRDAGRPRPGPRTTSGSTAPRCSAGSPPRTRPTASGPTPAPSPPTAPRAAPGVRLDGGTADTGVEISAHFDSMLVKLTCRGRTFEPAVARARRALAEFRIRGVSTNIPFLQAVLEDPDFIAGDVSTAFIEQRPELLTTHAPADRGTRLLRWLAEVTVNKPYGDAADPARPGGEAAGRRRPVAVRRRKGSRQRLLELGPGGLRRRPARAGRRRGHRHHLPRRPPVAARHPGPDQGPAADRAVRRPDDARAVLRGVLGRGDVRRRAAVPRTRTPGSGWPRCATTCPGCACRCCCAAATRSATRRTRPR